MLSIVTWLWSTPGFRTAFAPAHVNALARMVRRHYRLPHRLMCVTSFFSGFDDEIELVEPWHDFAGVGSPHGTAYPACYPRLRAFHPAVAATFGDRFVSLDLDWVIVDDVAPLWDRPEPFVALRDPMHSRQYNGSMVLLSAGARPEVWSDFDPARSPARARQAGCLGSDQGWVSYRAPGAPVWGREDGVFSYRADVLTAGGQLPADARMVNFHGACKPWSAAAQALPWVRAHWGTV